MRLGRDEVTFGLNEVTCPNCDETMRWDDFSRQWECLNCGTTAWQEDDCGPDEIYFDESGDGTDYTDYDVIPEGCVACGGDYPNCISGCNLMDD